MTFSILTFDDRTGVYAGAAATGSLCVGGWVLRGDIESGLCASQGTAPSTFWRDDALRRMYAGTGAAQAVADLTAADAGRARRQIVALDRDGGTGGFTGDESVAHAGHVLAPGLALAGNMIASGAVLDGMAAACAAHADAAPARRMIACLRAAESGGGDIRGLKSAALLVLAPDRPPLDLRIDHSADPLGDLESLHDATLQSPYADWLDEVPVLRDRYRAGAHS